MTAEQAAEALARMGLRVGVVYGSEGGAYLVLSHPEVDGAVAVRWRGAEESRPLLCGPGGRGLKG